MQVLELITLAENLLVFEFSFEEMSLQQGKPLSLDRHACIKLTARQSWLFGMGTVGYEKEFKVEVWKSQTPGNESDLSLRMRCLLR